MDHAARETSAEDIDRVQEWYRRTLGEIPRYVRFLATHRPGLLKAYRDRCEHAIRDSLRAQMLPWMLLRYNLTRCLCEGIRENALLGRALGVAREQLLDAICYGVLHAAADALGIAEEAAGVVLASLE